MDILFPWRKQPLKQQQPLPPPPQDGNNFGGGGGSGYHSLPHPQEHMLQSHLFRGSAGAAVFSSNVSEVSSAPSGSHHGANNMIKVKTFGDDDSTTRSTRSQQRQHQPQRQRRRGSRDSSKLFSLDESNRSVESELTDRTTGAAAAAAGATGGAAVGGGGDRGGRIEIGGSGRSAASGRGSRRAYDDQSSQRRPSLQSKDTSSSYPATTTASYHLNRPEEEATILSTPPMVVSPVRQLLDVINMSILPSSLRLASLNQAMEFLDHRDKNMHDAELRDEGAAFVLYQKLGLVLQLSKCSEVVLFERGSEKREGGRSDGAVRTGSMDMKRQPSLGSGDGGGGGGLSVASGSTQQHNTGYPQSLAIALALQRQPEFDKEISMVCSCLEMAHRANHDAIAQTWDECGVEILPLLVRVLERPFQRIEHAVWMALQEKTNIPGSLERAVATAVTRDQKLAVQKATKVLAMYSLVPEAKQPMCDCKGMLHCLTRIIDTHYYNRIKPGAPVIGGAASKASDRVLRGVDGGDTSTLSGTDGGESQAKLEQAKRLEIAASATSGAGLYMTEAARFNTVATLTNLAADEANRMRMLREPGLLDNICRVVFNERSDVPKECAALAIMNLSHGDIDHVPEICNDFVLETLLKLMKEDNPVTKRNAVVTIFNAACSDENTVRLARYRDGIVLEALIKLVGADNPAYHGDDEARANAAETLFNMACSSIPETTDRMANHAGLLECLAVTLRSEHTGLETKMYCSATLRRMAEIIHYPMISQGALLSALVKAATWTKTDCIAEAFHSQAKVTENRVVMARHHGLLNALSRLALAVGDGQDIQKVRMASCLAIEFMSREEEARDLLSRNEGIIMALTQASYRMDKGEDEISAAIDEESRGTDDDMSLQSRMIQISLKNLLSAM